MTVVLNPPGLFMLRGQLVVRRAGWLEPQERVECPFGHNVHEHAKLLAGTGVYWCKHRPAAGQGECGALMFVAQIPHVGRYCADVTAEEMRHMEQECMTAAQIFNYLGLKLSPGRMRP